MEKRATIITYGCQMNVNESAKMKQMLQTMGYNMTEDIENTDLVFLNTCTVREGAAVKVYGKLGDLKKIKEEKDGKQSYVSTFFLIITVLFFCFTYGYSVVGLIVYRSKDMK